MTEVTGCLRIDHNMYYVKVSTSPLTSIWKKPRAVISTALAKPYPLAQETFLGLQYLPGPSLSPICRLSLTRAWVSPLPKSGLG